MVVYAGNSGKADSPRHPVNEFLSVNLTVSGALTVFGHHNVGGFYDPGFARIPLTTVFGLRPRVNASGMKIASCGVLRPRWTPGNKKLGT
jgi:hypothetical protein